MKLVILLTLLLSNVNYVVLGQNTGIHFQQKSNWKDILTEAKVSNKYIFVDAYTTWCGPCKQMDEEVYPNKSLGDFMNSNFISVKIQMDETDKDNAFVRSWREDANKIRTSVKIEAFPSFLFYAPDGVLVYKSIGYHDVRTFQKVAAFAIDPKRKNFLDELLAYKNGKRDYTKMADLAITVKEFLGDKKLGLTIARDYKSNFLDRLPLNEFLKLEHLKFIQENGDSDLINTNDFFFKSAYTTPTILDSLLGKGTSDYYVKQIISSTILSEKLYVNGQVSKLDPNWSKISNELKSEFPKADYKQIVLNEKVTFYRKIENWNLYSRYKSKQIRIYPPNREGMGIFFGLNVPAWDAFLKCNDKVPLKRALLWSEQSLRLERTPEAIVQYLDTKANLLYKLGRIKEAIIFEKQALHLAKEGEKRDTGKRSLLSDTYQTNIEKMQKCEPTWP